MKLTKEEDAPDSPWESWTVSNVDRADFERLSPPVLAMIERGVSSHRLPFGSAHEAIRGIADYWVELTRS